MDKNHFRLRNRTPLSVGRYLPWPKSVYDFRFRFFLSSLENDTNNLFLINFLFYDGIDKTVFTISLLIH